MEGYRKYAVLVLLVEFTAWSISPYVFDASIARFLLILVICLLSVVDLGILAR